jgi:hypothetical protein
LETLLKTLQRQIGTGTKGKKRRVRKVDNANCNQAFPVTHRSASDKQADQDPLVGAEGKIAFDARA